MTMTNANAATSLAEMMLMQNLLSRNRFKLIEKNKVSIHDHIAILEKDFHLDNMSDKSKINIFKKSVDQDTLDLLFSAEEAEAVRWATSHEPSNYWGEESVKFTTPNKETL